MIISQRGQTLIETVVALFIMVMGITAALGLASYSFNASSGVRKQIIGTGLAREGLEAVKNMRDTNWLNGQLDSNCNNFFDSSATGKCYRDWLSPISGTGYTLPSGSFFISYNALDTTGNGYWLIGSALGNPWGLNTSSDPNVGLYTASATSTSTSGFYRQMTITPDATAPFNNQTPGNPENWPRLLVQSRVWWTDKSCPATAVWPGSGKCSIQLQTYLTNWKTY